MASDVPATLLAELNDLGRDNGIGRLDLVENRFVGMKSRGVYETPGGTILLTAHRAMESITLDRGAAHLKDELMPRYAELIYNGFWFSPEREMLQAAIDQSQKHVEGEVTLKLYKGNVIVTGRRATSRSIPKRWSPSRTTAVPTTRRMRKASSAERASPADPGCARPQELIRRTFSEKGGASDGSALFTSRLRPRHAATPCPGAPASLHGAA
jgi:hypothetical protein